MALLTLLVLVSGSQVSPVQKVIELLDGLKGKVQADLASEEALMGDFTKWCDSEANDKEDAITSNTRTKGDLAAAISDASASIGGLTSETEELAAKISSADADLKAATKIRSTEHGDFSASESELVETVDTLARAIIVLKRGQSSFLQKSTPKELSMMADGLSKVIAASWVSSHQKQAVQALLQQAQQASDGDEDLELAPQATTAAYESQGGSILDVLDDMKTKAEEALSGLRKDEMASSHAYQLLKQSLDTQLKADQKRMNAASTEKSATTEAKASAEEDLAATAKALAADTSYLEDLKTKCAMKGDEWAARQKSAGEEIQAIEKAREILSNGVKVFLQVGKSTASTKDDQDKRMKVTQILRRISRDAHQFQLTQITAASQNDEFSKVRGLVEAMIARLTQEAAEEADAKSFCDTETAKSKAKQADLSAKADMHAARVEKGTAEKAKLEGEVKQIQEQLAAMDAGQAEATKLRSEEKAAYKQASSDYKQSADAVASAIEVLSEYYNKGSFVQVASSVRQAPDFSAGKTDVAGTIMEMLEVAESDFTRLLAEADADESQAQEAFDKLVQENAVTKAAKQAEIRGNEGELKQLQTALLNSKEDAATTAKELDATLAYLDKLKPQCESKVMTYAERVQKREDEIAGLKEALEILEA